MRILLGRHIKQFNINMYTMLLGKLMMMSINSFCRNYLSFYHLLPWTLLRSWVRTSASYVERNHFCHQTSHPTCLILLLSVVSGLSNGAIRSIRLVVDPVGVRRGQSATLRCLYDLDGAPLLSLQFYRGSGEFYRYSPTQSPTKKVFPLSGINVDVSTAHAKISLRCFR